MKGNTAAFSVTSALNNGAEKRLPSWFTTFLPSAFTTPSTHELIWFVEGPGESYLFGSGASSFSSLRPLMSHSITYLCSLSPYSITAQLCGWRGESVCCSEEDDCETLMFDSEWQGSAWDVFNTFFMVIILREVEEYMHKQMWVGYLFLFFFYPTSTQFCSHCEQNMLTVKVLLFPPIWF